MDGVAHDRGGVKRDGYEDQSRQDRSDAAGHDVEGLPA